VNINNKKRQCLWCCHRSSKPQREFTRFKGWLYGTAPSGRRPSASFFCQLLQPVNVIWKMVIFRCHVYAQTLPTRCNEPGQHRGKFVRFLSSLSILLWFRALDYWTVFTCTLKIVVSYRIACVASGLSFSFSFGQNITAVSVHGSYTVVDNTHKPGRT